MWERSMNNLAEYWGRLRGVVHPDDQSTFAKESGRGFNLSFPPPAFVGDIVNAPVIILENNGGYDPHMTPREFPDESACDEYRETLAAPGPVNPKARSTSPYYLERNYSKWLIAGEAALVNGVAYRSVSGKERAVTRLTKSLPSALFHQRWLHQTLLPLVQRRERFVVLHRWTRWNNAANAFRGLTNAIFSSAPISKDLTPAEFTAAQAFLNERKAARDGAVRV
jgi:hypothetical protein